MTLEDIAYLSIAISIYIPLLKIGISPHHLILLTPLTLSWLGLKVSPHGALLAAPSASPSTSDRATGHASTTKAFTAESKAG